MTRTLLPCPADDCAAVLVDAEVHGKDDDGKARCPFCLAVLTTDAPLEWSVLVAFPGRDDLRLPCPTAGVAQTTAGSINADSTKAQAAIQTRPAVGWSS